MGPWLPGCEREATGAVHVVQLWFSATFVVLMLNYLMAVVPWLPIILHLIALLGIGLAVRSRRYQVFLSACNLLLVLVWSLGAWRLLS